MIIGKETPVCACSEVHEDAIGRVRKDELPLSQVRGVAELFKILGDPTRLRLVQALSGAEELCVCDIALVLGMSQSAVSHQLAILRQARLVKYRKDGKVVYYSLDDGHVASLIAVAVEHVSERKL